MTSIPCKILEHLIYSSVYNHLEVNSILCDAQHGFRKKRSCETQLIVTINEIASRVNLGEQVDVLTLDFSKAFDKVPHERLFHKLQYYGIQGTYLNWIKELQDLILEKVNELNRRVELFQLHPCNWHQESDGDVTSDSDYETVSDLASTIMSSSDIHVTTAISVM